MAAISNRPMSRMRKMEAKEALFRTRKRILRHLVQAFLRQEGFPRSAEVFAEEAQITDEYEVCDNVDLDIIFQDYCSYYLMRFNKQPQFLRPGAGAGDVRPASRPARRARRPEPQPQPTPQPDLPATFTVTCLSRDNPENEQEPSCPVDQKPLGPLLVHASPERRQLVEMLYQDIIKPTGENWDDVKGLAEAKSLLMESVVYPVRYPSLFAGRVEPWRGVLLHGPPGAGKTRLARAAAALAGTTFFNVSPSTLVNKWRGDSEKIVKILFEMGSYYAPSIIFMDEVETLTADRCASEHEASRRLRAQLLAELDGVRAREGIVLLLANSNVPWDIDPAMLRRLEKRIYIPLPDQATRAELFQMFLSAKNVEIYPKVDYQELAARTEGYSGSDIRLVCKEALMSTVRKTLATAHGKGLQATRKDRLHVSEILTAIEKTKPVSKHLGKRHEDWQREMGCC